MIRRLVMISMFSTLVAAEDKVTYEGQVMPVFQQSCLNCHNADKAKGGLDLSSFAATIKGGSGGKIVEPGNVTSRLIQVVEHTAEPHMPPEGEKLSTAQCAMLKRWIDGGLLENATSTARKPAKSDFVLKPLVTAGGKPAGPPPMPERVLLDPPITTAKGSAVRAISASPWAPVVAVTGQRQVLLYDSRNLELVGVLPYPEGDPVSLAFTPDGRYLIVGGGVPGKSGVSVVIDVVRGVRVLSAGKEFDSLLGADISPAMDVVVTGGPSRLLKWWDARTGVGLKVVKKHTDWITALDLSPDGVLLASGDRNGGVWVWESQSGNEFHTLRGHQAAITAVVFRADSNMLATASEDGSVRFWEMNGGNEVKKIMAHAGGVTGFSYASDGSFLTIGRDMKARLWKADFNPLRDCGGGLPALPTAAALDANGSRAFVGDVTGCVHVFNTADGKLLGECDNHPPSIAQRLLVVDSEIAKRERDGGNQMPAKQAELGALRASRKHWHAAEINTRWLAARETTEAAAAELSAKQDAFIDAVRRYGQQVSKLHAKRDQGQQLATLEMTRSSAEARAEQMVTLCVSERMVAREMDLLRHQQEQLLDLRAEIDHAAHAHRQHQNDCDRLQQAYDDALK